MAINAMYREISLLIHYVIGREEKIVGSDMKSAAGYKVAITFQ
jgi:hypothetical protein